MQWSLTVSDLVSQLEAGERAEIHETAAALYEAQLAEVALCGRLRSHGDATVRLTLAGGTVVVGRVTQAVPAWALLDVADARERPAAVTQVLVSLPALTTVAGLLSRTGHESSAVERRLGLGHALRRVASARLPVALVLVDGSRREGTITGVGADHVDLRPHPMPEPAAGATLTVPFTALAAVASRPLPE